MNKILLETLQENFEAIELSWSEINKMVKKEKRNLLYKGNFMEEDTLKVYATFEENGKTYAVFIRD